MPLEVNGEAIRYDLCPNVSMADGLERYFERGILPGGFMVALLCGDFREMCAHADHINRHLLWQWGYWLYNYAPGGSWGSQEAVERWIKQRREIKNG